MRLVTILVYALTLAVLAIPAAAQPGVIPTVSVRVEVDVSTLDLTSTDESMLRIVVANLGVAPVDVPIAYDEALVTLAAQGDYGWPLTLWEVPEALTKSGIAELASGEEHVLFEAPLRPLFTGAAGFSWTWMAHPTPPPTPLVDTWGEPQPILSLWAEIEVDGVLISSAPTLLRVVTIEPPETCATDADCDASESCQDVGIGYNVCRLP